MRSKISTHALKLTVRYFDPVKFLSLPVHKRITHTKKSSIFLDNLKKKTT